jgi:small multidrug resistance pump
LAGPKELASATQDNHPGSGTGELSLMLAFLPRHVGITMRAILSLGSRSRLRARPLHASISYRKVVFMCWIWLFVAILLEVAATVFMKLSNGFSKLTPTLVMALLYGISFFPLAIALKKMEVSTAYAVWSAVGTALVTMIGMFLFKETMSMMKVFAIALIILGVVTLNLTERSSAPRSDPTTAELTHSANTGAKDARSQ